MYRQLYQMGGSINRARDFFIREKGLDANQADNLITQGLQAFNTVTEPQSMMQMASNGGRIGYQMGGITSMPMNFGQPLQVPQQTSMPMQPMMSSPMANYGQTPLTMAGGGIARLGYGFENFVKGSGVAQPVSGGDTSGSGFGGMGLMGKLIRQNPQMFRQASNQQRLLNASSLNRDFIDLNENGIDDREEAAQGGRIGYQMGGETEMAQMSERGMPQEQSGMQLGEGDNALLTIIQLLIEEGIDPETAQRLARQILAIFAQGGEPALDQFINQLEQQEQTEAMASGGIAGYAQRQGYGWGSIVKGIVGGAVSAVKGVSKAVKSVVKSPIGRIALTVGAGMLLGPAGGLFGGAGLGASLTGNAFLAGAINAGAANLLVQGITTGRINPKEALLAAGLGGVSGYFNPGSTGVSGSLSGDPSTISQGGIPSIESPVTTSSLNVPLNQIQPVDIPLDSGSYAGSVQKFTDVGMITPSSQDVLSNVKASNLASSQGQTLQQLGELTPKPTGFFESIPGKVQSGIQSLYKDPIGTISDLAKSGYESVKENIIPLTVGAGVGAIAFGAPQQPEESNDDFAKRQQDEANASITQFGRNLQIRNPYFYARYGAEDPFAVKAAQGGIMGYAAGGSMIPPARRIEGGVIELDARKTGGYIPYGKKERVDDVPAMLAKDEFVFTSRAVKGAGDGSARRGAAKMYKLMKQLEAKGKKMERQGARA